MVYKRTFLDVPCNSLESPCHHDRNKLQVQHWTTHPVLRMKLRYDDELKSPHSNPLLFGACKNRVFRFAQTAVCWAEGVNLHCPNKLMAMPQTLFPQEINSLMTKCAGNGSATCSVRFYCWMFFSLLINGVILNL